MDVKEKMDEMRRWITWQNSLEGAEFARHSFLQHLQLQASSFRTPQTALSISRSSSAISRNPLLLLYPFQAHFKSIATMALKLVTTSNLQAFSGLRAAPSVRQVNKLSGVGCVRRSCALQPIKAVMNPMDDPILKEAMKEPLAFLGGVFAGLLRLDLNEEPLKDWVAKTAEAAGIDLDDSQAADVDDSVPEDIRID